MARVHRSVARTEPPSESQRLPPSHLTSPLCTDTRPPLTHSLRHGPQQRAHRHKLASAIGTGGRIRQRVARSVGFP